MNTMGKFLWTVGACFFFLTLLMFFGVEISNTVLGKNIPDHTLIKLTASMVANIGIMFVGKTLINDWENATSNRTFTSAKDRKPPGQG